MSERSTHDNSAAIVAGILGVVLIAVSLPFALGSASDYIIVWSEAPLGSQTATATEGGDVATASIGVTSVLMANVTVSMSAQECSDSFQAVAQNPAQATWRILRLQGGVSEELATGSFTCADGAFAHSITTAHPDVGSVTAESAAEAIEEARGNTFETATYTLEVSATRAPGTLPVPLPTSFEATVHLDVKAWDTGVQPKEVPK